MKRWQDWTNVVAGAWTFGTPWMYGYTSEATIAWNAWTLGVLIALVGLWALRAPESRSAEWTTLMLGGWLLVAPWILSFIGSPAAAWNAGLVGLTVLFFGTWALVELEAVRPILRGTH